MEHKHSYWIPTNRPVNASLNSYLKEVDYWYQLTSENIPVCILDSGDAEIESQNLAAVKESAYRHPNLIINHIGLRTQRRLVSDILERAGLDDSYLDCFVPLTTNYGAVMNKIALLAAASGSDYIHRRDSDTTLQPNCPYPLETEMSALRSFSHEQLACSPAAIGSGYVGEWSMDLKPFIETSPELFSVFWDCMEVDRNLHSEILNLLAKGATDYYQSDRIDVTDQDGFNLPDAGNVAFSPIYQLFPSLPSNAMSSDYMLFRFARGCGLRNLFHTRRVVHEYHPDRGDQVEGYLKSLLKYCDLRPIYTAFERAISNQNLTLSFDSLRQQGDLIAQLLNDIIVCDIDARIDRLQHFITEFIAARYPNWTATPLGTAQQTVEECTQDYQNHVNLIRKWDSLIQTARHTKPQILN